MTEPAPKRRLPIVSNSGGGSASSGGGGADEEQDRPPWHWSVIGAAAIFLAWLPLTMLASYATAGLVARAGDGVDPSAAGADVPAHVPIVIVAMPTLAFGIASFAGGFLVGRYGGKAGKKEATVAGFLAAAVAWALAASQPVVGPGPGALAWALILVTIAAIGAIVAYAGGRWGLRRRPLGLG